MSKDNQNTSDNNSKNDDNTDEAFFNFFSKYFWFAIVVVLLSIITQNLIDEKTYGYFIISILVTLFSTLGLTILVASLFTYTLGTKEFIEYIENKLENIIIGRNF